MYGALQGGGRTVEPVVKEEEGVRKYPMVLFLGVRVDRIASDFSVGNNWCVRAVRSLESGWSTRFPTQIQQPDVILQQNKLRGIYFNNDQTVLREFKKATWR